jgi:hypothetical protein
MSTTYTKHVDNPRNPNRTASADWRSYKVDDNHAAMRLANRLRLLGGEYADKMADYMVTAYTVNIWWNWRASDNTGEKRGGRALERPHRICTPRHLVRFSTVHTVDIIGADCVGPVAPHDYRPLAMMPPAARASRCFYGVTTGELMYAAGKGARCQRSAAGRCA